MRPKRRWIRRGLILTAVVLGAVGLASVVAYVRLDGGSLARSADAVVERSRAVRDGASPDYQSQALAGLPVSAVSGPVHRLEERLAEARVVQAPEVGELESEFLLRYEFEGPEEPSLVTAHGRSALRTAGGLLVIEQQGGDSLRSHAPLAVPMDDVAEIAIRLRVSDGTQMTLAWSPHVDADPDQDWQWGRLASFVAADGDFHTYVIDAKSALRRHLASGDLIRHLMFQPSNADGARCDIDFIRVVSKLGKARRHLRDATDQNVGGELRRCLSMVPGQILEFPLEVPPHDPVFAFGAAVLREGHPLRWRVAVAAGDGDADPVVVHEAETGDASRWADVRLDLSAWAGRQVGLQLAVDGAEADNIAFWSNPVVYGAAPGRFNVIVVLEDTLRADHLSAHGHARPTSPHKDRLASERGILFSNAFSQATKTRPSVPSMMTSLLPTATGVWYHTEMLAEPYLTLAEVLRAQGFATASFIQNGNAGPAAGLHQGFGTLLDMETLGLSTESILGDRATGWLADHRDRNVFVYLHVIDPHGKYDPPAPYDTWYRSHAEAGAGSSDPVLPRVGELDPDWCEQPTAEGRRLLYDGEIAHNDALIGRFVERIGELGMADDTLLVFTSDHGEYLGEGQRWGHFPPGRREVTHVPLMFVYPGRFEGPARFDEAVQLLDVMPTILELAGIGTDGLLLQGDSLLPLIEGEDRERWADRVVLSEEPTSMPREHSGVAGWVYPEWYPWGSLHFRDWHLISSRRLWPTSLPSAFKVRTLRRPEAGGEASWQPAFLLDAWGKRLFTRTLRAVQENNRVAWQRFTAREEADGFAVDPDVLEQLRELGYVVGEDEGR